MGNGIVLGNRIFQIMFRLMCRIAMMQLRVTLARLIWSYDIVLKNPKQEVPWYSHKAFAAGPLEVRLSKVVRD